MEVIIKNNHGIAFKSDSIYGEITINGPIFRVDGKSLDLNNVEGKEIQIHINGSFYILDVKTCNTIEVHGNVGSIQSINGDVTVHEKITGNVSTTNGDVHCPEIHGNVSTVNGDIG